MIFKVARLGWSASSGFWVGSMAAMVMRIYHCGGISFGDLVLTKGGGKRTVPTWGTSEMTGMGSSPAGTWRPKKAIGRVAAIVI